MSEDVKKLKKAIEKWAMVVGRAKKLSKRLEKEREKEQKKS